MATPLLFRREESDYDFLVKVAVAGDSGSGKSSLLLRYSEDLFSDVFTTTIGVDFIFKRIKTEDGRMVKLQLWDTAGQERFRSIVNSFWRGVHGIVIVFDLTNSRSFENVTKWHKDVVDSNPKDIPKILVGNKSDLIERRVVSKEQALKLADNLGMTYIETSAKNSSNVSLAFQKIAEKSAREVSRPLYVVNVDEKINPVKGKTKKLETNVTCCNI